MSATTTPSPTDTVRRAVTLATRRLRQRRALRFGATGFLAGSLAGFAVAVAINYNLLLETTLPGGGAFLFLPTLVGLVAGTSYGVLGKYESVAVARLLENRLQLKDRLSTALSEQVGSPLTLAQAGDAASHVPNDADIFRAVPLSPVPRRVYIAGAVALAVALTYFAPELPVFWNPSRRAERIAVRKEGDRLLTVAKAAAREAKKQNLPEAERAAKKVEALGKEMARGRMPLKEALIQRAKLGDELRRLQEKIARDKQSRTNKETQKSVSDAGRDLEKTLQNNNATPAGNAPSNTPDGRMKALQDALTRGDKQAAANALRDMADAAERGEPAPGATRDKTGQQLAAVGDALQKNNLPDAGAAAQNAGDALRRNALPDAARSLRDAADKIEQGGTGDKSSTQSPGQPAQSGAKSGEQNALQKMAGQVQKQSTADANQPASSQNSGSQPASQNGQNGAAQPGTAQKSGQQSGAQGQQSGAQPAQSGSGQSSQTAQSGQGASGKGGAQPGSGQRASGSKPGSGAGQGKSAGTGKGTGAKSGKAGGGGAGNNSTGNARTGSEAARLSKGAVEQNVRGKRFGAGPETVITETDSDRSGLPVSALPYYKEFVKRRGAPASESAQSGDTIPGAYKNQVRGYFDSLPTKKGQ